MPLDTTKSVKSITYNGTTMPLYAKPEQTKTVDLSMASGNQVISPDSGKVLSKVTVNKPSTLIPANVKKDVNIGGVVGTLEGGGIGDTSETWVLNYIVTIDNSLSVAINFTSNGQSFSLFHFDSDRLRYDDIRASLAPDIGSPTVTMNPPYCKVTFAIAPTGALLTWLQANGVKQEKNLAIQPSKSLTITSNGTTTITPDVPYDAMGQVGVTVNVASSGGSGETTSLQVTTMSDNIEAPIFCLWQTNDGWTGTSNFDSVTDFTIHNVIVGGYVIFTHDPATPEWHFICAIPEGVEPISVDGMDPEQDASNTALVIKVTALSPSFRIRLMSV